MKTKPILVLILSLLFSGIAYAQTQQGFVKTKGRMVNGKHVPGQGLKGASVTVQGRTAVLVEKDDGAFSFPVPAQTFMFQSVQKNGYELVDVDALKKPYNYSTNPIYILMETPEQQTQDQLESERKIRRTLQRRLQQREDELEALKEANRITLEEYQHALQKLYDDQQNNEQLIADMAKQYAQLDYDQMDELNQRISDAILNGRLTEADSLLRTKGDMKSRVEAIRKEQQAEAQREEEIAQEQAALAEAKAGTQKRLEDIASDCKKFFDLCKLNMQWDSAAYYIETRAELDTTNAEWQFDAAYYFHKQNDFNRAEKYYVRDLAISRSQNYNDYSLSATLNNFAILYKNTQRLAESEAMYLEALEILRRLAQDNPQAYEPDLAMTLNNLANLYKDTQRLTESEAMYLEALEIGRRLAQDNPQAYEPDVARTLHNLAILYSDTQRLTESEAMYLEALEILRRLAQDNPQAYEPDLAMTLNNLANLYKDTQRLTESEAMYLEALEICRQLAQDNPQAYEPDVASTLNNLAILYNDAGRLTESEKLFLEALEIYRRLAKDNPQAYEPIMASILHNLSIYYFTERFAESKTMCLEALEIRRRLAKDNPQVYEPDLAGTLVVMGGHYMLHNKYLQAISVFEEARTLYRRLKTTNPSYDQNYEIALKWLSLLYAQKNDHIKGYEICEEWLSLLKKHYQDDVVTYRKDYVSTLLNQSYYCIFVGQLEQSEQYAKEALSIDSSRHLIFTNLAAALLFQGKYNEAEQIYRQYKDELRDSFLQDFIDFEAAGVIPKERKADVERIRKMLRE